MHNNTLWWFTRFHIHIIEASHYRTLRSLSLTAVLIVAHAHLSPSVVVDFVVVPSSTTHSVWICVWMRRRGIEKKGMKKPTEATERNGKTTENTMVLVLYVRCQMPLTCFACEKRENTFASQRRWRRRWRMSVCRMAIRRLRCAEYNAHRADSLSSFVRSVRSFCVCVRAVCRVFVDIWDPMHVFSHSQFWFCLLRLVIRFCDLDRNIRQFPFFRTLIFLFQIFVFRLLPLSLLLD